MRKVAGCRAQVAGAKIETCSRTREPACGRRRTDRGFGPILQPATCNLQPGACNRQTLDRPAIVAAARLWLGTPYVHQASAKGAGTDCLGLVRGVWRDLYGEEPEIPPPYGPDWNERAWLRGAREEPLLAAARRHLVELRIGEERPGDVLVFRVVRDGPAKHCGIMSEEARFIHAYAGRAVVESWLSRWWRERLAGVFVYPGADW